MTKENTLLVLLSPELLENLNENPPVDLYGWRKLISSDYPEYEVTVRKLNSRELEQFFDYRILNLLKKIEESKPSHIQHLAEMVDGTGDEIMNSLQWLESLGVIEFRDNEGFQQPIIPYDRIEVEVGVTI